jgi:hypothetical protein
MHGKSAMPRQLSYAATMPVHSYSFVLQGSCFEGS